MKISSENIKSKVSELSKSISTYYKENHVDELCVVVPMNGGVPFAVDILREISNPGGLCEQGYVAAREAADPMRCRASRD